MMDSDLRDVDVNAEFCVSDFVDEWNGLEEKKADRHLVQHQRPQTRHG